MTLHRRSEAPRAAALVLAGALLAATPAAAQQLISGFARSDQTDVTGIAVTSADLLGFEPGIAKTYSCPVAWGVRTAAESLALELGAAGSSARADLLALLDDGPGARDAGQRLALALAAGNDPAGARLANGLVPRLRGLLASSRRMDPARPGPIAATRLHASVAHFNRFVDASSPAFLAAPPAEFVALNEALGRMVRAAEAHEARFADPSAPRAPGALACAPVAAPPVQVATPLAPPPPAVEELRLCVVHDGRVMHVTAQRDPATGRTTHQGQPFEAAFPDRGQYAQGADFFIRDEPITHGGRQYVRFGTPRVLEPGQVSAVGEFRGVPVFVEAGGTAPAGVVYLPVRAGCEFQPYQLEIKTGGVRG
jgi:hypothetical protein